MEGPRDEGGPAMHVHLRLHRCRAPLAALAALGALIAACGGHHSSAGDAGPPQQDAQLPPFGASRVLQLGFGGDSYHLVELDGYGAALNAQWTAPERSFLDANPMLSKETPTYYQEHGAPVAYVRASRPSVTVEVAVPADAAGTLSLHGAGTLTLGDDTVQLAFDGEGEPEGGTLVAEVTADRLPDRIDAGTLTIEWTVVPAAGGFEPAAAGSTSTTIYLLATAPIVNLPVLHTPVALACEAARGADGEQAIIDAVWARFVAGEVYRARDAWPLQYYGQHHDAPGDLRPLLVTGAGQCTTWAYLMYCALGVHGVVSEVTGVFPYSGVGRIYVGPWRTLDGSEFVTTGADGVCNTTAQGDDEQAIPVGQGRPYTKVVAANTPTAGTPAGDDVLLTRSGSPSDPQGTVQYPLAGANGIVETSISTFGGHYLPTLPLGFGLAQQRAYVVTGNSSDVVLGGDDTIVQQLSTFYVLTGRNGILETSLQSALRDTGPGVYHIDVGNGYTATTFYTAIPIFELPASLVAAGDDRSLDGFWVDSGPDGLADTAATIGSVQVIPVGQGLPAVPCVGPGPDGVLDTVPSGDDGTVSVAAVLALAPSGFPYVEDVSLWPLENGGGQAADAPPPDFPNHVILSVGGVLYDPSYAAGPFATHEAWEAASLSASGTIVKDSSNNVLGIAVKTTPPLTRLNAMLPPN
jgi:hypothetical protein